MSNKTKVLKAFFNAQMAAITAASLETIEHLIGENKDLSEQNLSLRSDLAASLQDATAQEKIISKLRSVNVDLDLKLKGRDSNFGSVGEKASPANSESQDLKEESDEEQCDCPGCTIARLLRSNDGQSPIRVIKVNLSNL
ncbi:MAG: hypothetical protein ACRCUH_15250 [Shewanella sp.]